MYNSDTMTVVCAAYNRPQSLRRLLDLLNDQRCVNLREDVEVIVVDDGSDRDLSGTFPGYRFPFTYIYRPRAAQNLSRVYSARNTAAARGSYQYILQLDDDLEFSPYALNLLQSSVKFAPKHWVWGARMSNNTDVERLPPDRFERGADGRWFDGQCKWQETHYESMSSAGMFMPRRTWELLHGYDEYFDGSMGAADQEFALRVQKLGERPGEVKAWLAPWFVNIADEETGSWRDKMIERRPRERRNEDIFDLKHPDRRAWTNV
jgi:glycosyltransferase involved in cell wall biosynthesis